MIARLNSNKFQNHTINHTRMERAVSKIGREATFGTPEQEVERILAHKTNYYVCLKVTVSSDESEIKYNYLRLSRMVHPDKCHNPGAGEASATLNQAKDTLMNPLKKRLYDAYIDDLAKGQGKNKDEMTYAEWEASNAARPVHIPAWLEKILGIKVVGQVVALILLIILIPLLLIALVIGLVLWLLCLPLNILVPKCCPEQYEQAKREYEQAHGRDEERGEGSYEPPQPQQV
jgi:hypothetical protein